jgi:hypothetical protein
MVLSAKSLPGEDANDGQKGSRDGERRFIHCNVLRKNGSGEILSMFVQSGKSTVSGGSMRTLKGVTSFL